MSDTEIVLNFYHLCQSSYKIQHMTERGITTILKREYFQQMVEELAGDMRAIKQHKDITR